MRPLLVYVADKNMAEAVNGLLDCEGFHRAVASLRRCTDPALQAFLDQLRIWFPVEGT